MSTNRGTILLTTLWVLVMLSTLALGLAFQARLELAMSSFEEETERLDLLVQGALNRALARLEADKQLDVDAYNELWAAAVTYNSDEDARSGKGEGESVELHWLVLDENRKISINTVSEEIIAGMLEAQYGAEVSAPELASYILDWIDADDVGYGESRQYAYRDPPYSCRNDAMRRIDEMLCVQDVTPWLFFGEDANCDGVLDPNEDDGDENLPFDNADGRLQQGLRDLFTVYGEGEVNANTVDGPVLEAVCNAVLDPAKAREVAGEIVAERAGPDGEPGTSDDRPFTSISSIRNAIGSENYRALSANGIQLVPYSRAFTVIVEAKCVPSEVQRAARVVVSRERDGLQVVSWQWS